jgi:hypothetical protein
LLFPFISGGICALEGVRVPKDIAKMSKVKPVIP